MERSMGQRAPVLWLLLPTMGGFALARALPAGWGGGWWLALAACGVALTVFGVSGASWLRRLCWGGGLVLAVGATACAYFQLRENRLAVWERLPAREAELVLEIERDSRATSRARGRRSSSTGRGGSGRSAGRTRIGGSARGRRGGWSASSAPGWRGGRG